MPIIPLDQCKQDHDPPYLGDGHFARATNRTGIQEEKSGTIQIIGAPEHLYDLINVMEEENHAQNDFCREICSNGHDPRESVAYNR